MQRHLIRRFKIISGRREEAEASVNKLLCDPNVENIIRIGDTCVIDKVYKVLHSIYILYEVWEEEST